MTKYIIVFLFVTYNSLAQKEQFNSLMISGDKAFQESDFNKAKSLYLEASKIDSLSQKVWYNLAATELNNGNNEIACNYFYKSYELENPDASIQIKTYCGKIKYMPKMNMKDADQVPKFSLDNSEYDLIVNHDLNPIFKRNLISEMKKSEILKKKVSGKIFMSFNVKRSGQMEIKYIRIPAEEQDIPLVKLEVTRIFRSVKYLPATYEGKAVDTYPIYSIPLDLKR